jgi:hypothetical protein
MTDKTTTVRRRRIQRPAAAVQPELIEDDEPRTSEPALEETETVIVSRGVIWWPHPTEKKLTGRNEDGTLRYAPRIIQYRPGCEIALPVSEANRLIELGTVIRPGENPKVGPHPDLLVRPDRPEDRDPPQGERGPVVSALDDDGRILK